LIIDTENKDEENGDTVSSFHSGEIKRYLDNGNMESWYFTYENYVNPIM